MSFHTFEAAVAKEYGIPEAILIRNFQFWIIHNRSNEKHFYDGRTWTYNSVRALEELFPYMSRKVIYGALGRLQDKGVLLVGNYNEHPYDRTQWYAFADEARWISASGEKDLSQRENESSQTVTPIPDSNKDSKPNSKQVSAPGRGDKGKAEKKKEDKVVAPPRDHWQALVDTWFDFYKSQHKGEEPNFLGRNPGHFGKLVDLLRHRAEKKAKHAVADLQWTAEYATRSLRFFLEIAYSDEWLKAHFLLANLVDQFDAVYAREAVRKQAKAPPPQQNGNGARTVNQELDYLVGRHSEHDFDERIIRPDHYDMLTGRGILAVGTMNLYEGISLDEKKRAAVLQWLKTINKKSIA